MTIAKCKKCGETFATTRHIEDKSNAICENCLKEYLLCENCGIDVKLTPLGECPRCGADLRSCQGGFEEGKCQ